MWQEANMRYQLLCAHDIQYVIFVFLALSLLCVKKFSGSGTMLEAPPGSREDLVEAARTPCTPTGK